MPKTVKEEGGTLWAFRKPNLLENIRKQEGAPFGDIEKFSKVSHKQALKHFGQVRDSNPRTSASQTSKNPD